MKPIARNSTSPLLETLDRFELKGQKPSDSSQRFGDYLSASNSADETCPIVCRFPRDQRSPSDVDKAERDADPSTDNVDHSPATSVDDSQSGSDGPLGSETANTNANTNAETNAEASDADTTATEAESLAIESADDGSLGLATQAAESNETASAKASNSGPSLEQNTRVEQASVATGLDDRLVADVTTGEADNLTAVASADLNDSSILVPATESSETAREGSLLVAAKQAPVAAGSQLDAVESSPVESAGVASGSPAGLVDGVATADDGQLSVDGLTASSRADSQVSVSSEERPWSRGDRSGDSAAGVRLNAQSEELSKAIEMLQSNRDRPGQQGQSSESEVAELLKSEEARRPASSTPATMTDGRSASPEHLANGVASLRSPVDRHQIRLNASQQRRFVQRVARAFELAQQRDGEIRLRLSPPALGSLKVEIKLEGRQMSARLEAENQTSRQLLLEHLPALRDRLAEQGISIETFEVDLYHDEPRDSASEQRDSQRRQQPEHRRLPGGGDIEAETESSAARTTRDQGVLNVMI